MVEWLAGRRGPGEMALRNGAGLTAMQVAAREQQIGIMHWLVETERSLFLETTGSSPQRQSSGE